MDIVRLMGYEQREYDDKTTGEKKSFCGLHVVYEQSDDGDVKGKKCENFSCPREVNPADLAVGKTYELKYSHFKTKNGMGARISGMVPCEVK